LDTIIQRLYEDNIEGKISDAYSFLRLVKTYTDIKELNAEIIRSFIEKVYVYVYVYGNEKPWDRNTKKIKVIFNFIGEVHIPSNVKTA
jgi:site-specific DNA recombinase